MDPWLTLLLGIALGAVLGALCTVIVLQRRAARDGAATPTVDPAVLEARHQVDLAELRSSEAAVSAILREELASVQATTDALREQLAEAQRRGREFDERHREEAAARTEREQRESKVLQALAPVRESLHDMQLKVSELEAQRSLQHGELSQQLRSATESEERLRSTAESLASALRANNTRGVWGETQLRSVVEAAGLIERVDFDVQSSISSDAGAGRPDMVVHLPGGKNIAVDAKVPFTAFLEASQIPATATGAEGARRTALLGAHVKAVRDHITALGSKAYWQGLEASPEIVIAFIPSESLVSSALEADPSIMEFAFSKRVALASPVTLWSVLKTVAFTWQQDVLTHDAKMLFDLSRELYARLAVTATHIEKLGRSIERTVKDYNGFVGSMERQVLPTARKLNALDESKVLAPLAGVEESPRELVAWEFVTELEAAGLAEAELEASAHRAD
ncbi:MULTISPECIES: DNA recombination protein RmuC [unclassified Cryobacterium]|uniref:DNA recombination protein RmuC n=1 Tax=unclassified Cryobacterium TaxID=2649013 RepID=UPI001069D337|nr:MULTISPECIES: DNA recombination protein RmuC [unclassified Cryobacterium]MDY7527018.1 DNA recombination protein RmuC [Cryobacterium sp. 10C2]MEB0004228.1 DNA recombination protein RmuC [Cryobacterium sp. RTC2.1]MEB0203510.1 DNA recombination protein RmuC [Cryobacterium sp. 5I3]MEB0287637.1 DNA recombination protein RmuC [Cryobacterium sp. 10S3]MEB0292327.1 DNA recombination protein RmuC [Cryobacterium sp. 10C2]